MDFVRSLFPVDSITTHETPGNIVVLTGDYAYKFKKSVDLGFLDFTTLDKRLHFCERELELNRQFSPEIYLGLVGVYKKNGGLKLRPFNGDRSNLVEIAVKMVQFKQDGLCLQLIQNQLLTPEIVINIAKKISAFHQLAKVVSIEQGHGAPESILADAMDNFSLLVDTDSEISTIEKWTLKTFTEIQPVMKSRLHSNFIRGCHGDLHLGNIMVHADKQVYLFDCIEFNDRFRFIDTANDLAFLVMDLDFWNRKDLAFLLINTYLEESGDYGMLAVLKFYCIYRAMIRAKVAFLRKDMEQMHQYIHLATHYLPPNELFLGLMWGLSGSGKSVISGRVSSHLGAIRLRADVERKRIEGLKPLEMGTPGLYSKETTKKTFAHMAQLAKGILGYGYGVIVDATFLKRENREIFWNLSQKFFIVKCVADVETLRRRITGRKGDPSDATLTILDMQLETIEAKDALFTDFEKRCTIEVDSRDEVWDALEIVGRIKGLIRLGCV